jgi:endonuclease YncB( thermonuclease family)
MGRVVKFRRKRSGSLRQHFPQAYRTPRPRRPRNKGRWSYQVAMLATMGVALGGLSGIYLIGGAPPLIGGGSEFTCPSVRVIDGDTFDCGQTRVRLQGIDAPEMPGHCRPGRDCTAGDPWVSTASLERLLDTGPVVCRKTDTDRYGRTVARCYAGKVDLSCKQIDGGFAVKRYAAIWC